MPRNLKDAVVVITGASSGIGQATAEAFARQGSKIVIASRNAEALEAVAKTCEALGGQVIAFPADVTDPEAIRSLADQAMSFGRIDVWVSNAGIGAVGRFHETPLEAHQQIISTNLIGHVNDAYAVLPIFLRQNRGVFINMISLSGFAAAPFAAAYSASKFGLRGFSEALRGELVDKPSIHVCDIYPAFIDTPGLRHGANYIGRHISAPPPVVDPRRVAAAIVALARSPRPTTTVGSVTNAVRFAHLLAPNLVTRIAGRFMAAYFRQARHVEVNDGNLFRPAAIPGGIDGGFRSPSQPILSPTMVKVLSAGCFLYGGWLGLKHARRQENAGRRPGGIFRSMR